jgi:hypothetical protein
VTHLIGTVEPMNAVPVLVCPVEGRPLRGEGDALDMIGEAVGRGAAWAAIPVERLAPEFFQLSTGVAGAFAQKFAQYGVGLAVVGDITRYTAASASLRALAQEANRGAVFWFVQDLDELRRRMVELGAPPAASAT